MRENILFGSDVRTESVPEIVCPHQRPNRRFCTHVRLNLREKQLTPVVPLQATVINKLRQSRWTLSSYIQYTKQKLAMFGLSPCQTQQQLRYKYRQQNWLVIMVSAAIVTVILTVTCAALSSVSTAATTVSKTLSTTREQETEKKNAIYTTTQSLSSALSQQQKQQQMHKQRHQGGEQPQLRFKLDAFGNNSIRIRVAAPGQTDVSDPPISGLLPVAPLVTTYARVHRDNHHQQDKNSNSGNVVSAVTTPFVPASVSWRDVVPLSNDASSTIFSSSSVNNGTNKASRRHSTKVTSSSTNRCNTTTTTNVSERSRSGCSQRDGDPSSVQLTQGNLRVEIDPNTGLFTASRVSDGAILLTQTGIVWGEATMGARKGSASVVTTFAAVDGEMVYGLGEHKTGTVQRKPFKKTFADSLFYGKSQGGDVSIPMYTSSLGYAFVWNLPSLGSVDIGSDTTTWVSNATLGLDIWVATTPVPARTAKKTARAAAAAAGGAGSVPSTYVPQVSVPARRSFHFDLLHEYADAVGHPTPMPTWTTGFIQCKDRYRNQTQLLNVARGYASRGLPVSLIVIDWFRKWTKRTDY